MLAAKFYDDQYYNNEYYSRVGGITKKEINELEIEFLNYINFNLYVDPILFFRYREKILSQVVMQPRDSGAMGSWNFLFSSWISGRSTVLKLS